MPLMNGTELAEKVMSIRPEIPVILCTGFTERITEEKAKCMTFLLQ
jgi:two-component SAPR family response regulator